VPNGSAVALEGRKKYPERITALAIPIIFFFPLMIFSILSKPSITQMPEQQEL
jgi:hypothetical protein